MKYKNIAILLGLVLVFATSCFKDQDDNGIMVSEINDFVWKGMNTFYLYKSQIPNLANDRFSSNSDYGAYLNSYNRPESLFESLIYDRENVDRYSWITDDYIALEQQFSGVSKSNGMEFGLRRYPDGSNKVYGYIRYILPNSDASSQSLERGQIFNTVNGEQLYFNSASDTNIGLLNNDQYAISFADYDDNGTLDDSDDNIIPNSESVSLIKSEYSENPIFKSEIIILNGQNVGYLMLNGFIEDYNAQLNTVFANFAGNNIQNLVLDLRYNPGGSVNTAILLGSMITGINNDVFAKLQYNSNFEETIYPFRDALDNGTPLNRLNLSTVYILATQSSASASEMMINSLDAHIEVIHIGTETEGKSQASITVYDSPNFQRQGANPNHTYALQPLIAISVNKNNLQVPPTGKEPDHVLGEETNNLGLLGDENEPLLAKALELISGKTVSATGVSKKPTPLIGDSNSFKKFAKEMYIDEIPNQNQQKKNFD